MKALVVARKEFLDTVRSRFLWGVTAVFSLLAGGLVVVPSFLPGANATARLGLGVVGEFTGVLVPIVALVGSYLALAGERESGSLKLLLGSPATRGEVVAGKAIGRVVVILISLLVAFVAAGVLAAAVYGSVPLPALAAVTALTGLLGASFVGVGVGISAVSASRARAMTVAIGVYLAFVLMWDVATYGLHVAVEGSPPGARVPSWFALVSTLSPTGAYGEAVSAVLAGGGSPSATIASRVAGGAPAFLDTPVMVLVLVVWGAVPLVAGYLRFRRADLG